MNTISKRIRYNICYFDFPSYTEELKSLKSISPLGNFVISRNLYKTFLKNKNPNEVVILSASFGAASNILLSKKYEVSKSILIAPVIKNLFKSTSNKNQYSKFFKNFWFIISKLWLKKIKYKSKNHVTAIIPEFDLKWFAKDTLNISQQTNAKKLFIKGADHGMNFIRKYDESSFDLELSKIWDQFIDILVEEIN